MHEKLVPLYAFLSNQEVECCIEVFWKNQKFFVIFRVWMLIIVPLNKDNTSWNDLLLSQSPHCL